MCSKFGVPGLKDYPEQVLEMSSDDDEILAGNHSMTQVVANAERSEIL